MYSDPADTPVRHDTLRDGLGALQLHTASLTRKNKQCCRSLHASSQTLENSSALPMAAHVTHLYSSLQAEQRRAVISTLQLSLLRLWDDMIETWFVSATRELQKTVSDRLNRIADGLSRVEAKLQTPRQLSSAQTDWWTIPREMLPQRLPLKTLLYLYCQVVPETTQFLSTQHTSPLYTETKESLEYLFHFFQVRTTLMPPPSHPACDPELTTEGLFDAAFYRYVKEVHTMATDLLTRPHGGNQQKYLKNTHSLCFNETELVKTIQFYETHNSTLN